MPAIPACTLCGQPTAGQWCSDCRERMQVEVSTAEAEALFARLDTIPTVPVDHDLF